MKTTKDCLKELLSKCREEESKVKKLLRSPIKGVGRTGSTQVTVRGAVQNGSRVFEDCENRTTNTDRLSGVLKGINITIELIIEQLNELKGDPEDEKTTIHSAD